MYVFKMLVRMYKIHGTDEAFFFLAAVPMVTENVIFFRL